MAARFEQKFSFNKLNYKPTQVRNYKLNSQTKLKLRVGVVPGVCHPRLRLHPVLINPVLVRTQTPRPLYIASGIGRSNTSLTLLDPLAQPPQGAEVHTQNGGGHDGGIMQDLIMEKLVAAGWRNRARQQQLRLQLDNPTLEGSPVQVEMATLDS